MTDDAHRNPGVFKHLLSAAGVVVAVLVGFVLGLKYGDRNRPKPTEPVSPVIAFVDTLPVPDTVTVVEPVVPKKPSPSKTDIAQGVEYLATHNRWNRDEMEKIPVLQGLWDAVNHYDLETIRKYAEIIECPPLTAIIEGLEQSNKTGYYASKNDRNITLSTYIRRLKQQ